MKVKDLIQSLQEMNPEDEIAVTYWTRQDVAGAWYDNFQGDYDPLTEDQIKTVLQRMHERETLFEDWGALDRFIEEVLQA